MTEEETKCKTEVAKRKKYAKYSKNKGRAHFLGLALLTTVLTTPQITIINTRKLKDNIVVPIMDFCMYLNHYPHIHVWIVFLSTFIESFNMHAYIVLYSHSKQCSMTANTYILKTPIVVKAAALYSSTIQPSQCAEETPK